MKTLQVELRVLGIRPLSASDIYRWGQLFEAGFGYSIGSDNSDLTGSGERARLTI
jgi:hypothetical protein